MDFEDLYRATYPGCSPTPARWPHASADDAVAEAYAITWRRQRDIPRGAELGWLIGVTRRVLANARRGRRRAGALHALLDLQPRAGPDPADRIEDGELRAALLALSPLDREAVVLTAWFDLSSADAAQALGITPAAFRMRAARARRPLAPPSNPTHDTGASPMEHHVTDDLERPPARGPSAHRPRRRERLRRRTCWPGCASSRSPRGAPSHGQSRCPSSPASRSPPQRWWGCSAAALATSAGRPLRRRSRRPCAGLNPPAGHDPARPQRRDPGREHDDARALAVGRPPRIRAPGD